jgi:hypothetical protein
LSRVKVITKLFQNDSDLRDDALYPVNKVISLSAELLCSALGCVRLRETRHGLVSPGCVDSVMQYQILTGILLVLKTKNIELP